MKLLLLLTCSLVFFACEKHEEKDTAQQAAVLDLGQIKNFYCAEVGDHIYTKRCDKLTFKAIASSVCGPYDLSSHVYEPGMWHRDVELCLEPGDSRGECSPDSFIMLAHHWLKSGDLQQVENTIGYLKSNAWNCGEGEDTYVGHLQPLLLSVREHLTSHLHLTTPLVDIPLIATHNLYLTAGYIHAKGKMGGYIRSPELAAVQQMVDTDEESMIFQAIYHRYKDGDQQKAIDLIGRDCPRDTIPLDDGYRGWGSSPRAIHCLFALDILEGN